MSTLHKVKAYFGMAPMDDYDDEYYDDADAHAPRRAPVEDRRYPRRGERFADDAEYGYDEPGYRPASPAGYADEDRFAPRREFDRPAPRLGSLRGNGAPTRGALAMDPRRAAIFEEGSPLSKITTLRPKDYSEARTIGERFRDGTPVIMDLVSMDTADAKRVVDFAAGLAFALRGSFDKVATKVFLLSPADIDVSAEERRRIAESGFYSYQ
ncbi:cell division protein SepF [Mycobacterium sp. CBMA271]|uniref:cell division protein SepF n=1 Tax=unclassified Mycobacteroides TaxID=2618759 RepID=UPI0012DE9302|nr:MULTISPECIES: cell division protein SepF [unclassified Mycobacteroides]MUM18667.1 cell division protein SepF [Mycobacteroides sp. CBMA 326]MUM22629.1 cell division protein SepF [Mycobacteroides sp. CBMA 271]